MSSLVSLRWPGRLSLRVIVDQDDHSNVLPPHLWHDPNELGRHVLGHRVDLRKLDRSAGLPEPSILFLDRIRRPREWQLPILILQLLHGQRGLKYCQRRLDSPGSHPDGLAVTDASQPEAASIQSFIPGSLVRPLPSIYSIQPIY